MKPYKHIINVILTLLLATAIVVFPLLKNASKHSPVLLVITEPETPNQLESYYVSDNVWGNRVVISCRIVLKNISDRDVRVRLNGYSWMDFVTGTLKSPNLFIYGRNEQIQIFTVPAHSNFVCSVSFTGELGESDDPRKWDRSLPEISIEIVND